MDKGDIIFWTFFLQMKEEHVRLVESDQMPVLHLVKHTHKSAPRAACRFPIKEDS